MRSLWISGSSWSYSYMDPECKKMLVDADIDKAEEFIEVLKSSPIYQKMLCEQVKKKLEVKRAEVLALENSLVSSCT